MAGKKSALFGNNPFCIFGVSPSCLTRGSIKKLIVIFRWILGSSPSMTPGEKVKISYYRLFLGIVILLSACTDEQLDRLQNMGKPPPLEKVQNPREHLGSKPVDWPAPERDYEPKKTNSIWQSDSKTFFRDPRARNVGDILTIKVQISDQAAFNNETDSTRTSSEKVGVPSLFGFQNLLGKIPGANSASPSDLLGVTGASGTTGVGKINRAETITTEVAASITQVLPNGNFVITGRQEIRVNYEVREISIQGVIRPEDIASDNTISSNQVAEARIIYGGKGALSDLQTPRYGEQLIDILSPF